MILIDGSEGGGQILRTALALSMQTGQPFRIQQIRANRPKKGLSAQHLTAVKAAQQICGATVSGGFPGSLEIEFIPGKIRAGTYDLDIGTAGSITLLLQSLLLPSMFSGGHTLLRIKGGTDVKWSMPIDYFTNVVVPYYSEFSKISVKVLRRGYFPKGQGEVEVRIDAHHVAPPKPQAIDLTEHGSLLRIEGVAHASRDLEKDEVVERLAKFAGLALSGHPVNIRKEYASAQSSGAGICLWAHYQGHPFFMTGADALSESMDAEMTGEDVAKTLLNRQDGDHHLVDNLLVLLAVYGGKARIKQITNHIKTSMYTCNQFFPQRLTLDEDTIRSTL